MFKRALLFFKKNEIWGLIIVYGILLALIAGVLKYMEYQYFISNIKMELMIGLVALFFTVLGVWVGIKIINKPVKEKKRNIDFSEIDKLGISKREYEVLQQISKGYSNQEIADNLHISISTVKTHSSNLFSKLDVKRRTQAITKAKEINIL